MTIEKSSSEYILESSRDYSIYVCSNRAIPQVTDGLKDGQRKMLWLLRNRSDKIKTVSLSGLSISEGFYLHGDQSASDSISMMAAPYCNNVPLLDGIGTFGTRTSPTGWGAARYTYVKRGKAAQELIFPDLDIVPLKENYDGSNMEPVHFLPLIPTVLLNGVSGIAVGWSTDILPRSFADILEATIAALDGKKIKQLIPSYDYLSCGVKHLEGNSWEFTGKVEILDSSTVKVVELPPDLSLEKFKERLNDLEENNTINSYIDRSTKIIDITVKFARGFLKDRTADDVIALLKLKQKSTERIVVVDWNGRSIRQYATAEQVVKDFVAWRLGWFATRYKTLLGADQYELKYWQAIKMCFDKKLPANLGKKNNREEVQAEVLDITKGIGLDGKQVDRIVQLPTFRWAKDAYDVAVSKIAELEASIVEYQAILADKKRVVEIYKNELMALKKLKFN